MCDMTIKMCRDSGKTAKFVVFWKLCEVIIGKLALPHSIFDIITHITNYRKLAPDAVCLQLKLEQLDMLQLYPSLIVKLVNFPCSCS